jgi:hypothetical protein
MPTLDLNFIINPIKNLAINICLKSNLITLNSLEENFVKH